MAAADADMSLKEPTPSAPAPPVFLLLLLLDPGRVAYRITEYHLLLLVGKLLHSTSSCHCRRAMSDEEQRRRQVEDAIRLLPGERRAAYEEAMEKAPHLVAEESPVDRFLRFKDGDPWAAAESLANYWELRKEVFEERTFMPLTQTGNGALTTLHQEIIRSGVLATLPPDDRGRHVLVFDRSRAQKDFNDSWKFVTRYFE